MWVVYSSDIILTFSGVDSHLANYAKFSIGFFCSTIGLLDFLACGLGEMIELIKIIMNLFYMWKHMSWAYSSNYVWHTHIDTLLQRIDSLLWVSWLLSAGLRSRVQLTHRQSHQSSLKFVCDLSPESTWLTDRVSTTGLRFMGASTIGIWVKNEVNTECIQWELGEELKKNVAKIN